MKILGFLMLSIVLCFSSITVWADTEGEFVTFSEFSLERVVNSEGLVDTGKCSELLQSNKNASSDGFLLAQTREPSCCGRCSDDTGQYGHACKVNGRCVRC
ncbi:hypothetical protein IWQ49_000901 [Labrenzia sp. EL_126]|nr:hypothetical protein [Labrenzia sp. EL_126]